MRIPRIYTSQALAACSTLELEEAASHHLLKVLRMTQGRELILFNGRGGEYRAVISAASKKTATVSIGEFNSENRESPLLTELAIGISRGDRFDWVLQKATELGVTRIQPLFCERTEVKLNPERLQKKTAQWQKILVSACEQCQRNRLPELNDAVTLETYLASTECEQRLVLHHRSSFQLNRASKPQSLALLIGPEGGLSEVEIEQAEQADFEPLTLGPRVLRTETAPIAALSIIQHAFGDF